MKKFFLILTSITLMQITTFSQNFNPKFEEISFKNKNADFIKIEIPENYNQNLEIAADSSILNLSPEELSEIKELIIEFKSSEEKLQKEVDILKFFTTKKGLTATTEQLILKSNNEIIDMVCWENSTPAKSEKKDFENLNIFWEGPCLNSEEIPENKSIIRISEAKKADSWKINESKNHPPTALIKIQKGKVENEIPFSLNLTGEDSYDPDQDKLTYQWNYPDKTFDTKNPPSYRFEKAGNFTITLIVSDGVSEISDTINIIAKEKAAKIKSKINGTLSKEVKFSEIFANPKGKDTKKEWIELFNASDKKVNLQNWEIESNGKKHKLKNLSIGASEYLLIKNIPLKNSKNTLRLKDFQNKLIDEITYIESPEDLSFNKTEEGKWLFLKQNPLLPPPKITIFEGTVFQEPKIEKEFFFKIKTIEGKIVTINFDQPFNFKTMEKVLKENSKISLTAINENQKYFLQEYKITKEKKKSPENKDFNYFLLFPIPIILGLIYQLRRYQKGKGQ